MAYVEPDTVMLEGVRLIFKNFEGRKEQYNADGERNFAIALPFDQAQGLMANKWNVKVKESPEEGEEPLAYLPVKVNFDSRPAPRITLISSSGRTMITPETAAVLDTLEYTNIDVMIRAYDWEVNGKSGRKAYLQTAFFTLYEDPLELKYAKMQRDLQAHGDDD